VVDLDELRADFGNGLKSRIARPGIIDGHKIPLPAIMLQRPVKQCEFGDAVALGDFKNNVLRAQPTFSEKPNGFPRAEFGVSESAWMDIEEKLLSLGKLAHLPNGLFPANLFQ
jgi:hypothetical protein